MHKLNSIAKKVPMATVQSIFEGVWNGIIVSGVLTISVVLVRSATALFLF